MKRKIVRHGPSSLTVSLPMKWAKAQGLKPGDEIDVEEKGNAILISSGTGKDIEKEVTIHFPTAKDFFKRNIARAYILGYNQIKITYDDPEVYRVYSDRVNELLGFEIVEQGKNYVVLKNVAKGVDEQFDTVLNRLFFIVINMGESLYDSIKNNDFISLKNVLNLDRTADKFSVFCKRMLHVHGEEQKSLGVYRVTCYVESIADDLRNIANSIINNKIKVSKSVLDLLERINKQFRFFYKIFHNFNQKDFIEYRKIERELENDIREAFKKTKEDAVILSYLHSSYNKLHHASEELF